MLDINDSYQLVYKLDDRFNIIIDDSLLKKLNERDYSLLPPKTTVLSEGISFFKLEFCDKKKLKIFMFSIECKFKDIPSPIKIFSFDHFKIILQKKIQGKVYKSPYYHSNVLKKDIYIDANNIDNLKINIENYIEIKDKEEKNIIPSVELLFNELNQLFKHIDTLKYSFQFISPNFKSYFPNLNISLMDEFLFIYTKKRIELQEKISQFLEQKDDLFLYPLCGPHGTGKTISALIFHKLLFKDGKKGLYLNLKYYYNKEISFEKKIETLTKECFYICDSKEELIHLYNLFITKQNIYELFQLLKVFLQEKNGENKENNKNKENNEMKVEKEINENKKEKDNIYNKEKTGNIDNREIKENIDNKDNNENVGEHNKIYIIIDQYQEMYCMSYLLDLFNDIKVILLSSINDFDVKENLILKFEDEVKINSQKIEDKNNKQKIIKYHYIDDLIDNDYYDNKIFQNLIKDKIKKKGNNENEVNKEFEIIYNILKDLGFIPKYFFEYLYYYDSIFDLLFNEYSNINKKLGIFYLNKNIDINTIDKLKENKYLIKTEDIDKVQTLQKNEFVKYVKFIPLKYINFKECENGMFYFYFSFPLLEKIIDDFIYFQRHKQIYFSTDDAASRGLIFERLLKYQFRVHKKFNLDGYFEVDTLINMKPTKTYANINQEYISTKKNIFIDQQRREGEDYNFAIYRPQSKQLLLFQAKYIINKGNVDKKKSLYETTAKKVLEPFNKLTKETIGEIYLLFISGIYYNYKNRKDVINILTKQRINCIFYSLKKDFFYFNFKDIVTDIKLENSYMLIPSSNYYKNQEALDNCDFENEEGIYFKYEKIKKKKKKFKRLLRDDSKIKGEKKENELKLLLKKRTIQLVDNLEKIYVDILSYIKNKTYFNNNILKLLGPIKNIESSEKEIDLMNNYAIIFYLDEKALNIDYNKKLGLIIYHNGVHYFVDLKENKTYKSYSELIEEFQIYFLFAIGIKKEL